MQTETISDRSVHCGTSIIDDNWWCCNNIDRVDIAPVSIRAVNSIREWKTVFPSWDSRRQIYIYNFRFCDGNRPRANEVTRKTSEVSLLF